MRSLRWAVPLAFLVVLAIPASGSADGDELIVLDRANRIVAVHSDGSGLSDLGPGFAPALSPEGTRIAFLADGDVWVLARATGARTRITSTLAVERDPVWSPDGTRLAFASLPSSFDPAELDVAAADGTGVVKVASDFRTAYGPPAWSPDADELAYTAVRGSSEDLVVARADGSGVRSLTADDALDRAPAWSPRADTIAFLRSTTEGLRLHLIEADGTAIRQLSATPATTFLDLSRPVWSRDGRRILFFDSTLVGNDRYGPHYASAMRVVELGGGERALGAGGIRPAWSDDGNRILYNTGTQAPGEESELQTYVMNADGSCQSRVAAGSISAQPWYGSSRPALRCTDVQLTVKQDRSVVGIDGAVAFEVSVGNIGTEPASGVWLDVDEPVNGSLLLSAAPGECSVAVGGSCSLGTIAPGGAAKVLAVVQARRTGQVRTSLHVRANEPDRNQAGNHARLYFDSLPCTHAGSWGDDSIVGTAGNDVICALTGRDVIRALGGADTIDSGNGADRVFPGPGRDSVDLKGGADFVDARDGRRDVIACGGEPDIALVDRIDAVQDRCEVVSTTTLRCTALGTSHANTLTGSPGRDSICSFSGSDAVDAGAGNDEIDGGTGNDTLTGGSGRDLILGDGGNDLIKARDGARDTIRCGSELDLVIADRRDVTARDCERVLRR
jgi:Tol biopolymer transport system component